MSIITNTMTARLIAISAMLCSVSVIADHHLDRVFQFYHRFASFHRLIAPLPITITPKAGLQRGHPTLSKPSSLRSAMALPPQKGHGRTSSSADCDAALVVHLIGKLPSFVARVSAR